MLTTKVFRYWLWSGVIGWIGFGCFSCDDQVFKLPMPLSAQSAEVSPPALPESTPAPASPDIASSPEINPSPQQLGCQNTLTQAEINACARQMAKTADQALNQAYQKLRGSLKDSSRLNQLVDAQLAWIQFRDANCAFEKSRYAGGSISPTIFYGCVEQMTKQRTQQLKQYSSSS